MICTTVSRGRRTYFPMGYVVGQLPKEACSWALVATLVVVGGAGATWADLARRVVVSRGPFASLFLASEATTPLAVSRPTLLGGFSDSSQTGRRHLPLFALYRFGLLLFLRSPPCARCSGDPTATMQEKLSTDAWVCRLKAGSLARFGSSAHLVARDARQSDVTGT